MISRYLIPIFGRNWRTTIISLIVAIAGYIAANPDLFNNRYLTSLAQYVAFGGFAVFGIVAKDKSVSGVAPENRKNDAFSEDEAQGK